MRIFEPLVADGFEWINACNDRDYETFFAFDGQPRSSSWTPISVVRVRADGRQEGKPSDFPWLGAHALVLRSKAIDALRDLLESNGELLPLATTDDVALAVFNVRVVDALDLERSTVLRFPGTERVMRIKKASFDPARIAGVDAFRLPYRASSTYLSERFVDRVLAADLVGLNFNLVWST